MEAALKAGLFVGAVLLLGAGLFARWVGPELSLGPRAARLRWGLGLGAALLIATGLAELAATVQRALGSLDAEFLQEYALHTRHGRATLARSVLALGLVGLGLGTALPRALDRALYVLLSLGVLASLSLVSHSGVMGLLPFLGDLAHLVGAALWAGALLYFAWVPDWREERARLVTSIRRVSSLGLFSVALLAATGVYTATLHLYGAEALTRTSYGLALVVKVALVLVILAVAAANRWVFMPSLERGRTTGLRRAVRLESLLLLAVLGVTGVLATREPPHDHGDHVASHDLQHDHALPAAPETGAYPNTLALASGPATAEPLLEADGTFTLVLEGEGLEEGFEVVDPEGRRLSPSAERVPTHHGASELWLTLPGATSGRWELFGPEGERFAFTVHEGALQEKGVTAFFLPTPSLTGGGLSEVFVYVDTNYVDNNYIDNNYVDSDDSDAPNPLFMSYRMPGMEHAGDIERFELEQDPSYHDGRAAAHRVRLNFPMAGNWEVSVVHEDGAPWRFALEVLDE